MAKAVIPPYFALGTICHQVSPQSDNTQTVDLGGSDKDDITIIKMKKKHASCDIEYFVETHLCKLCVILRSRVLRVVCPH